MAAILDVLGVVGGAVSLVPFLSSLLAPSDSIDNTHVRIVLGSSVDEAASFGGNTPGVSLWDFNGNAIGFTDGSSHILSQGNFADISVQPFRSAGNIQAEYISVSNGGNDAVCIAGISVTFPDGAVAGFSTNVAALCGALWSNSNTPVLGKPASGIVDNPKCVWIDRDGSNGIPYQGMGLHLPSFSSANQNLGASMSYNHDLMCKSGPRFRMYPQLKTEDSILVFPHPPEFITDSDNSSLIGTDKDPGFIIENPGIPAGNLLAFEGRRIVRRSRSLTRNIWNNTDGTQTIPRRPLAELLIISPHSFNSARELCESWNSFGHSFVSLSESLFCDMTDKSLYYTCSENVTTCCLDADKASFRGCQQTSARPTVSQANSTLAYSATLRGRQANNRLSLSWMKGDKAYDGAQRW